MNQASEEAEVPTEPPLSGPCRLLREALPWQDLAPERASLAVRGEDRPFALIGRWAGGGALIGSEPVRVAPAEADPFELLDAMPALDPAPEAEAVGDAETAIASSPVGGGWFGYFGYGLGADIERLDPPPPPGGPRFPPFSLAFYDHLLHLDRDGQWWFEALVTPGRAAAIEARLARFRESLPAAISQSFSTEPWRAYPSSRGHERAIVACRDRIHAGDLFQANICQRLSSRFHGDPLDLFASGAERVKPDRAAFLAGPWGAVASFSPELFLERHGRRVRTAPIKGTRPRPEDDPRAAAAQRAELAASAKDRAENQMIVDMARNDLGRVCSYGSVAVEVNAEPRAHTGVWHLVSEVTGRLHDGLGDRALLRATFPPASVTGAPKIAAENVIAELESSRREIYTGAIGFASPLAGLELNVAIRGFEFGPALPQPPGNESRPAVRAAWLGVGGGIVADSEPLAETEECRTKAAPLLGAVGGQLAGRQDPLAISPALAPAPLRLGAKPIPRPDPARGVFETILVEDGVPQHFKHHLERLAASLDSLYGSALPPGLAGEITGRVAALEGPARLRVDVRPSASALEYSLAVSPLPARPASISLAPVCLPGGLGAHKWADRDLVDRLAAVQTPHLPLLCDLDGEVLEAAHATVFADLGDGCLTTPPLDGRILPGVARARLLAGAHPLPPGISGVAERPLPLALLPGAGAIYIANALLPLAPATLAASVPGELR